MRASPNRSVVCRQPVFISLILLALFMAILLAGAGLRRARLNRSGQAAYPAEGLAINFLDVGQGAATLLSYGNEHFLIDSGDAAQFPGLWAQLAPKLQGELKVILATHYDADHIGGLASLLEQVRPQLLLGPDYAGDTETYQELQTAMLALQLQLTVPDRGYRFSLGRAEVQLLVPPAYDYQDDNDCSLAAMITLDSIRILIMGDQSSQREAELIAEGRDLKADVLLLAHHGSAYSSSAAFLAAVRPTFAVISCGQANDYGHPAAQTLERLAGQGVRLFRTDLQGAVYCMSDGQKLYWDKTPIELPEQAETVFSRRTLDIGGISGYNIIRGLIR
ncbi:MBL fold metallo-hydrolase [Oscillospiraceae bacterium HV4-5-C5C]|nr:MBL fold metallo-hydrolase [Oscillospiraceae bacterium HV4-5-C5C]